MATQAIFFPNALIQQEVLGRTNTPTSLHNLTVNNLVDMVTMEYKESKPTAEQSAPNKNERR
jgi:hypothetical protein